MLERLHFSPTAVSLTMSECSSNWCALSMLMMSEFSTLFQCFALLSVLTVFIN